MGSLADGGTAAASLMTSNGHVVVQVKNISYTEPTVLNPAHPLQI
jgi:hypothetical protein